MMVVVELSGLLYPQISLFLEQAFSMLVVLNAVRGKGPGAR